MRVPQRWSRRWQRGWGLGVALIAFPLLGLFGLIGSGQQRFRGERFVSKLIVVRPAGEGGVRITENVDVDFGPYLRHGYERIIPHDFGIPVEVTASSTANATVNVDSEYGNADVGAPDGPTEYPASYRRRGYGQTRIRVGSPDETFGGVQRYTLTYTLPNARLDTGFLRLDIIGTDETLTTDRFEVVLDGVQITDPTCSTGPDEIYGGCDLALRDDGTYRAVIAPLEPGNGITIGGDLVAVTTPSRVNPTAAELASPRPGWQVALILLAVEAGVLLVLYAVAAFVGANRVVAGGATAAAFSSPPLDPSPSGHGGSPPGPAVDAANEVVVDTDRVTDAKLEDLATIEFEPPVGIRPWMGAVLLNEAIDGRSIGGWLAEMIAVGAIRVDGPRLAVAADLEPFALDDNDRQWIGELFENRSTLDPKLGARRVADVWNSIALRQQAEVRTSGWWLKRPPTVRRKAESLGPNWPVISFVGVLVLIVMMIFNQAVGPAIYGIGFVLSFLTAPLGSAIGITALGVGFAAWRALAGLLPVRSAAGSAATLQVMSFRRFLTGSEGGHVDAAWDRDRLREYSGWAVALDAADAWAKTVGDIEPTLLAAPGARFDAWTELMDGFAASVDRDSLVEFSASGRYGRERANPWASLFESISKADWSSSSDSGFSGGSSSSSSSVGGGGGGGSSGTW